MGKNYSPDIVDAVRAYLDANDWRYTFYEEHGLIRFGLNTHGRIKNIMYSVNINMTDYNVYAVCPISPDVENAEEMHRMNEFLARSNYGLCDGNFEMDFRDGEIRYKTYVNCGDHIPSEETVRKSIQVAAAMYDRYSGGILGVLFQGETPEDAVKRCESEDDISPSQLREILQRLQAGSESEEDEDDDDDDTVFLADDSDDDEDEESDET